MIFVLKEKIVLLLDDLFLISDEICKNKVKDNLIFNLNNLFLLKEEIYIFEEVNIFWC